MDKIKDSKIQPSQSELMSIINCLDLGIFVIDIKTDEILFVNDSVKERYGINEDVEGKVCWKTFRRGYKSRCEYCPLEQLLKNPGIPVIWEEHDEATGRYFRNDSCIVKWKDITALLQHSTDITDMKIAEASLKKQLRQLELMSDISKSFTSAQDMQKLVYEALKITGEFMGSNQAFLSKYKKDEGVLECIYEWRDENGQSFIGNKNKWSISPDMDIYRSLTVDGFAAVSDFSKLTHPNFRTVEDYGMRAFLNLPIEISEEFWGILGFIIYTNTYEWSASDIHLGKLIAGIFSEAIRRRIAEDNLVSAKEIAEQASRAKGEFLASMSHEIRTPMNAIIGMTGIARNSGGDPQKVDYCLERIDSASRHLLGLINDILDMSKIEASKLELSSNEFDFERMLINIAGVLNFKVEEKKQNLIINIDKNVPSVIIGDELRLSQIIANLLSNAIKFTPECGTIILNAHIDSVKNGITVLLIEVIDNGIGISKEQQSRLFSRFIQADGGTARQYGGSGLGLTISKGLVELMDGKIWIDSELGKGAKFSFTAHVRAREDSPRSKLISTIDKNDVRILIVEENPVIRSYYGRVMKQLELPFDIVESKPDALSIIKTKKDKPYNMFFLDCILPYLDGIELTKNIKRIDGDSTVFMTVSATDWGVIEKDALNAGVDRFIFKPLFPSSLINAINDSLGIELKAKNIQETNRIYNFSDYKVLIVDDIEINREIIFSILEETQLQIDFAFDGAEAVSVFESNPGIYDLILMDIQMPEMNGYEATSYIRSLDTAEAKNIPIIAMTANVFREDVEKCIQAGMNDHIGKPINTDELLAKLDSWFRSNPVKH